MKIKRLVLIAAAALMALAGCKKEGNPTGELSVNPSSLEFEVEGGTQSVKVSSPRAWKLKNAPEWLAFTVNGKSIAAEDASVPAGDATVEVTATSNTGFERNVSVTFDGGTLARKNVKIFQAGNSNYTTIAEVRAMLGTKESVVIPDNTVVKVQVVSNSSLDALTSKKGAFVQDETGGLNLFCAAEHKMAFGDIVTIDLGGATLKPYAVLLEVEGVALDKITTVTAGAQVLPIKATVKEFLDNKFESQYIELDEPVQVAEADLSKTWVMNSNHTSINLVSKSGKTFVARTGKYATFGKDKVPQGSGTLRGIATIYNDGMQIIFAQTTDYSGLTGSRFAVETEKVVTDKIALVVAASKGADVTLKNATVLAKAISDQDDPENAKTTFLVTDVDGKDVLLVYEADVPGLKVGDNVEIHGTLSEYSKTPQITGAAVTINSSGTVTYPTPVDATSDFDTHAFKNGDYASVTGTYVTDGKYKNIKVNGATTKMGSILYPDPKVFDLSALENVPNVTFTGYYLYATGTGSMYNWFILTDAKAGTAGYMTIAPESQKISATETSASFAINSNVDWTIVLEGAGANIDKTSGNGNATITITVPENADIENEKVYTAKVSSKAGEKTFTLTQGKAVDPSLKVVELSNAEIIAAFVDYEKDPKATTSYTDYTISSASGDWVGNMNADKGMKYLQLRNQQNAHICSPVFSSNVQKVELVINSKTIERTFHCVPVDTKLMTAKDDTYNKTGNEAVIANSYGSVKCEKSKAQTVTIEFKGDTKQFKLIAFDGAVYIDAIKVYLK